MNVNVVSPLNSPKYALKEVLLIGYPQGKNNPPLAVKGYTKLGPTSGSVNKYPSALAGQLIDVP